MLKKVMKMVPKHINKSGRANRSNGNKHKDAPLVENQIKIDEDRSILGQPVDIGIRGVKDLMKALAGGTTELQDLLLNECSVIYECKICSSLFRSLANFISHKRVYCVKSFCYFADTCNKYQNETQSPSPKQGDLTVVPDMPAQCEQYLSDKNTWVTSDDACNESSDVVDGLCNLSSRIKLNPVKITKKRDIAEIVDGLCRKGGKEVVKTSEQLPGSLYYSDIAERVMMRRNARQKTVVELENINESRSSVFQTLKREDYDCTVDSMKIQLIELDRVVSKNQAILQENGKFRVTSQNSETEEEKNFEKFNCSLCESSFLTPQTLSRHIQMYHRERICYPCPLCRTFFASPSSVYRHLSKAHHRTEQQIRRLRPQVLSKARKRKLLQTNHKIIPSIVEESKQSKREADNWINNFEGALRCNGCGKLFNRRAVLSVHSTTCRKKMAFSNSSSSQSSNKIKTGPRTMKPAVKEILTVTSSKPVISSRQLPKSGILVRKDYCKAITSLTKPLISSLLMDPDKDCSCNVKSWKPIDKVESYLSNLQNDVNDVSNSSDKLSTNSLDSNCISSDNSTKKGGAVNKKSNTLNKVDSVKKDNEKIARKNFPVTPMHAQGISVKN